MYVRRSSWVSVRFDGSKEVSALRISHEATIALSLVHFSLLLSTVKIDAVSVYLPKFDGGMPHGIPFGVGYPSTEVGYRSHGRSNGIVDEHKVVVRIKRKFVRVKRPRRLHWGDGQLLGH